MQRPELVAQLKALRLYGMASACDELIDDGIRRNHAPDQLLESFLKAEVAERNVRSISHQLGAARFPVNRDLDTFDFPQSPVNDAQIRELYRGAFLDQARNLVFVGGPGTGKTHLAIALGSAGIRMHGKRVPSTTSSIWSINSKRRSKAVMPDASHDDSPLWMPSSSMNWAICRLARTEEHCSSI